MQLHTCIVASVKERIRSKLRTARKSKRWSKADKGRSNLAICRSGARALLIFPDITLESGGNFWKSWKRKTKIAPFGRSNTCRVFGLFIALGLPGLQSLSTFIIVKIAMTNKKCKKMREDGLGIEDTPSPLEKKWSVVLAMDFNACYQKVTSNAYQA